jgi:hypothetical protein
MFSFFGSSEITGALSRKREEEGGIKKGESRKGKQNAGPKAGVSNCFVID